MCGCTRFTNRFLHGLYLLGRIWDLDLHLSRSIQEFKKKIVGYHFSDNTDDRERMMQFAHSCCKVFVQV